eukprot:UN06219
MLMKIMIIMKHDKINFNHLFIIYITHLYGFCLFIEFPPSLKY